jgi:hypothetical protein
MREDPNKSLEPNNLHCHAACYLTKLRNETPDYKSSCTGLTSTAVNKYLFRHSRRCDIALKEAVKNFFPGEKFPTPLLSCCIFNRRGCMHLGARRRSLERLFSKVFAKVSTCTRASSIGSRSRNISGGEKAFTRRDTSSFFSSLHITSSASETFEDEESPSL